ncbi:quinolinate synthase NadA [Salinactinospora qingdaonensis]
MVTRRRCQRRRAGRVPTHVVDACLYTFHYAHVRLPPVFAYKTKTGCDHSGTYLRSPRPVRSAGRRANQPKEEVTHMATAIASTNSPSPDERPEGTEWATEVRRLAKERDAVILAHNYQRPEIQDVADHTGDSLALSRLAAQVEASTIVFCGVHFMAETAKILSPEKTVLLPEPKAGCSLADTITAEDVRAWRAEHPGATVVAYVNTSAAVKAETDICCTSSNAADVIRSIPAEQEILFLPDQFLGAHVKRITGRDNIHVWMGECHVHAGIDGATLRERVDAEPDAELYVHPECGCATSALYLVGAGTVPQDRVKVLSTGGMLTAAENTKADKVLIATETGMLHQLRAANPTTSFEPVNSRAECRYMKMITADKLLNSLRTATTEITVPDGVAERARASVERMVAIGSPGRGGE